MCVYICIKTGVGWLLGWVSAGLLARWSEPGSEDACSACLRWCEWDGKQKLSVGRGERSMASLRKLRRPSSRPRWSVKRWRPSWRRMQISMASRRPRTSISAVDKTKPPTEPWTQTPNIDEPDSITSFNLTTRPRFVYRTNCSHSGRKYTRRFTIIC